MSTKRKHQLLAVFGYGTLVLMALALALIAYWAFYPYKVIEFKGSYQMAETSLEQGQTTTYSFNYCKYMNPPTTVEKQFIDGLVFQIESPETRLPLGCNKIVVPVTIPKTLPPGEYYVRLTAVYHVNPIRDITVVSGTEKFNVTRAPVGAYGDATNNYITPTKGN